MSILAEVKEIEAEIWCVYCGKAAKYEAEVLDGSLPLAIEKPQKCYLCQDFVNFVSWAYPSVKLDVKPIREKTCTFCNEAIRYTFILKSGNIFGIAEGQEFYACKFHAGHFLPPHSAANLSFATLNTNIVVCNWCNDDRAAYIVRVLDGNVCGEHAGQGGGVCSKHALTLLQEAIKPRTEY